MCGYVAFSFWARHASDASGEHSGTSGLQFRIGFGSCRTLNVYCVGLLWVCRFVSDVCAFPWQTRERQPNPRKAMLKHVRFARLRATFCTASATLGQADNVIFRPSRGALCFGQVYQGMLMGDKPCLPKRRPRPLEAGVERDLVIRARRRRVAGGEVLTVASPDGDAVLLEDGPTRIHRQQTQVSYPTSLPPPCAVFSLISTVHNLSWMSFPFYVSFGSLGVQCTCGGNEVGTRFGL